MTTSTTSPPTLLLRDGRRLAFYDGGSPDGPLVIYLPGSPSSGLSARIYDGHARAAGVRWVGVDRPGYGGSDPHDAAGLTGIADDLSQLATHLGAERFVVVGESGGGPFALAAAAALPHQVVTVIVVAGLGAGSARGMALSNRLVVLLARHAPRALERMLARQAAELSDPERARRRLQAQIKKAPAADRAVMSRFPDLAEIGVAAAAAALSGGPAAATRELQMLCGGWDFRLDAVAAPVHLWHGEADRAVPLEMAGRLASGLRDATLHVVPEAGHSVGLHGAREVMATAAEALR